MQELSEKDNKHQIQLKEYQERLEKVCFLLLDLQSPLCTDLKNT